MHGELEWEEFLILIDGFLKTSGKIGDSWILVGQKKLLAGAYIVKREGRYKPPKYEASVKCELEESRLENLLEDNSVVNLVESGQRCDQYWEYHVVYSVSYCVPVLYFNAWRDSGELLTLEEIWEEVPDSLKPNDSHSFWNMISQQEHPILGKPYFQVHPCQTAKLISSLKCISSKNIFISWLSTVGPLVNLNLSPQYAL